jgi:futalosine hydrolase
MNVSDLTNHFPGTRTAVSKHLKILKGAKLVTEEKIGRERIYQLNPYTLREVQDLLKHYEQPKDFRVLVMTAVSAEKDAVLRGLRNSDNFDVRLAGVGPALAAARTAKALAEADYELVISAGIAGGFAGRAEVGSLVVATEIVAADLGAETTDGFLSLNELGFGTIRISAESSIATKITEALRAAGLTVHLGPVLTVSTATGTAATALGRASQVPGAAAEGMEGFGVATAALDRGLPILEIRAISNPVGPRDREAWRIKEALIALEAASAILREVL